MKDLAAVRPIVLLVAGAIVVGALALGAGPADQPSASATIGFWEAAARGFVSAVMVNETFVESGHTVTLPVGIEVANTANVPVAIPEEAVLMSPHPSQSPQPNPLNTTADVALTNATIPASSKLLYSFGPYVLAGYLKGPMYWDMEEMQFTKAGVAFRIGGETLPLALRPLLEHPFYHSSGDNTQTALWAYLRSYPTVVIGKQPLWSSVNGSAGQTIRVRIDATNMAVWATDDAFTSNVNVTLGRIEDTVASGWSVQSGSYSVAPDTIVSNSDGSHTLEWLAPLPAAQVSGEGNPELPTPYTTVTRFYTLATPSLGAGNTTLPRAVSDMNRTGTVDARSAPPIVYVPPSTPPNAPPVADAGGPYSGLEGETILLNASKSHDPDGDPLQFRWSFTDNGTWNTNWSSNPTALVRYTDEFTGFVRVAVTDGHTTVSARANVTIVNVPPAIENLTATASGNFQLTVGGTRPVNLTLTVRANGTVLATLHVVRHAGDRGTVSAETGFLTMNLSSPISVRLRFSEDGGCGRGRGRNPMWLNVTFPDGTSVVLLHHGRGHHDEEGGLRIKDLRPLFFLHGITFRATLWDPGADPLTAHWSFGDATNLTQVFPNGPANDTPEQVIGGNAPMDVTAVAVHGFQGRTHPEPWAWGEGEHDGEGGGAHHGIVVTLTVTDGDGASVTAILTLPFPWSGGCHEGDED